MFAIVSLETASFVGEIGLHLDSPAIAQIGYWIGEPFWNMGIATEVLQAVCKFGFERLQLERIYGTCNKGNPASAKVLEKNGMIMVPTTGNIDQYYISKDQFLTTN